MEDKGTLDRSVKSIEGWLSNELKDKWVGISMW